MLIHVLIIHKIYTFQVVYSAVINLTHGASQRNFKALNVTLHFELAWENQMEILHVF